MKSKPLIIAITLLASLLLAAAGWMLAQQSPQLISQATSPDGSWSIDVVAKQKLTGSYEIVANVKNAKGQTVNAFVIGLESDLAAIGDTYTVSFSSNLQAQIGKLQRVEKSAYFSK